MWYLIAAVTVFAVTGAMGMGRLRSGGAHGRQMLDRIIDTAKLRSLTIEQVNGLLARLEFMEAPEPVMGAMCYEAMAYPPVAEYICPLCGEKTIYEDQLTGFIEWELQGCRRMAGSIDAITEFEISLDERAFCSFCSPDTSESPVMLLRVRTGDGAETVNRVSMHDLRLLESFLNGRLYYLTDNDSQLPLREYSDRIRELLGLPETP